MTRMEDFRLQRVLEAKRSELVREIRDRRQRLSSYGPASESMDRVRHVSDGAVVARNLELLCRDLRLVEEALQRVRAGAFGLCASCGADIPPARLRAVPWSPLCVSCQEDAEDTAYPLAS